MFDRINIINKTSILYSLKCVLIHNIQNNIKIWQDMAGKLSKYTKHVQALPALLYTTSLEFLLLLSTTTKHNKIKFRPKHFLRILYPTEVGAANTWMALPSFASYESSNVYMETNMQCHMQTKYTSLVHLRR